MPHQPLKIGELADKFEISTDTVRYYERNELLTPAGRSDAGYRFYDGANQKTLAFILNAKNIGFTLKEIKYLLQIEDNKSIYSCQTVKAFVDEKRGKVQQQLAQLQQMDTMLAELSQSCVGNELPAQHCSILDGIEAGV